MLNLLTKFAVKQTGGGAIRSNMGTTLTIFLISLVLFMIKVILVQWSYNEVVPKISEEKYRKLTTIDAVFLVILIQSLFT